MALSKLRRDREVTKSTGGKHIEISKYNPMTGKGTFKEKDVEYKAKGSPKVKYVEKQVVRRDKDLNWKSSKESRKLVVGGKKVKSTSDFQKYKTGGSTAAWTRAEGKNPEGGLNQKGVASYRREHPGSKLKTAVTTKPSKIKPGSEAAGRRKSFCSRMSGMKKKLTSAKTANDPNSRINKSLRKWNC